ncbi:hypothetical protein [Tenacibaculum finnmarkense]|uniref:hypothetical protein n=1 Tax=Tenacibaculum finnmarkense TaxID=2781243 RepID=UPI001E2FC04E|nr:hypothetical protein [Tenacibaculum finnmarkense]MCD8413666.1 hypothetical protein [Tenacibaculum finnmarkense genomovar ulcerans]MCG8208338.1 hypothetical protein [Tenacibaculum finnmarkense genomovar finnmarkense]MCG8724303.1 hypothetical protein [Tenacibaculum finnmarkense]MCG8742629.1 hypothetical protein [Tenacibaculum finnmarkense]MCG8766022.1 hypothetical protein [Tenacibaculum finnmarkense]
MNFNQYLGKYVCGNLSEMDYPELAVAGLLDGFDSKYLGILAAMNRTDEISELRKYLKWTIEELNIEIPTKREAALLYTSGIINEILEEKKEIIKGVSEIKNDALFSYDFFSESDKYCYDSIGFENIHGLFVEYYDSLDKLNVDKKHIEDTKNEILAELKKWKSRLKNVVQHRI